jgi:SsrA-binding protein
LLNKHEILKIDLFLKRNRVTVIPLNVFLSHNKIKLTIATAKRKNAHDKRQSSKENDLKREIKKFMK